jgi:hypothetical protein
VGPTSKMLVGYLPLVIFAAIMFWRLRTMDKARPLRPRTFWIPPVLVVVLILSVMAKMPAAPWGVAAFIGGLVIGSAAGWQRARWMRLHVEGEGAGARVMVRQSPAAVLFIMAIAGVRAVFRAASGSAQSAGAASFGHMSSSALLLTDSLLGFALGMIVTHRVEIWRKAKALMAIERTG